MLIEIRDRASSLVAYVIIGLLIISFALWGIQEYFGGGGAPAVAEVNDVENHGFPIIATSSSSTGNSCSPFWVRAMRKRYPDESVHQAASHPGHGEYGNPASGSYGCRVFASAMPD